MAGECMCCVAAVVDFFNLVHARCFTFMEPFAFTARAAAIIISVLEQSKLYEEKRVLSRPRRPFIKEDIMQIKLNVKNMVMHL